MSEFTSFRSVIELWGSDRSARLAMAADIGATGESVRKWWERDRIPEEWWKAVLSSRPAREGGVTADLLVSLAAHEVVGS